MKLGSLFDGIGGFPLSSIPHGIEPVWASEIEPFPIVVTKKHFPNMKHLGDITQINGAEIEPVEIITGGSPCQDLSVAGKRVGLAGARSGLFMEQVRIIKEMRANDKKKGKTGKSIWPRFMVWENVPGAFSSNGGEDFRAVLEETARIADETVTIPRPRNDKWNTVGAIMGRNFSIAWRVLDAQYWGVPQRRRRIFLVADFAGHSAGEILFECESVSGDIAEGEKAREGITASIGKGVESASPSYCIDHVVTTGGNCTAQGPCYKEELSYTLKATGAHAVAQPSYTIRMRAGCEGGGKGALVSEEKSLTLGCSNDQTLVTKPQSLLYESHPNDSRVTGPVDIAPTISQRYGTGGNNTPLVQNIDCTPNGIAGTVSSKWAKGTGGPAGDEHYNLITQPTYALDRASFNQGKNAQYDFQITDDDKSSSLVAKGPSAVALPPRYTVRRLTPIECLRLQGFPDDWFDGIEGYSDTKAYKALGNSVAVPCVTWIMGQIAKRLEG